ncbi:MAG: leucyl aminopeptidase [bacterium]|nr:leucyl aminopeptidase [bacterium]
MQYSVITGKPELISVDTLVIFVSKFDKLNDSLLKQIDRASGGSLRTMLESGQFEGKSNQTAELYGIDGFQASRIILAGTGKHSASDVDKFRQAAGTVARMRGFQKSESVLIHLANSKAPEAFQAALEGCLLGGYKFLAFKGDDESQKVEFPSSISFLITDSKAKRKIEKGVTKGQIMAEGQLLVRDLASTPGNFLTPKLLASRVEKLGKDHKFSVSILDEKQIKQEKMGALLSVSRGSTEPARFIIMKHNGGRKGQAPVVLVGKGVTFDSGGISLKPGLNLHEMKGDMTGGACVIAALTTAARLNLPLNVVGLVPATENMPAGNATKPGDVVTSRKGLTIEIINTDAEGRLILADALDYANEFKPQAVIDIATLTGASLYIIGYEGAPFFSNNRKLKAKIESASNTTSEKVWNMPLWEAFAEGMKSPVADLLNSGGRDAGTCKAASFLEYFIGDWPWAHIDIAYVDVEPSGRPYIPKGATGIGLRLLIETLTNWKKL